MLISNSHRFIFIHLYKTAGSSVEHALSPTLAWNDLLLGSTDDGELLSPIYRRLCALEKHSTAREVREVIGAPLWDSYFSFATVRNPFSLAVSQYTFSRRMLSIAIKDARERHARGEPNALRVQHDAWPWYYPGVRALRGPRDAPVPFAQFIRSPHLRGWNGFSSQLPQLSDADGRLLVNEVVKQAELTARWPSLCAQLGLGELVLRRYNASVKPGGDYRSYYRDDSDVEVVREAFAADFDAFGYTRTL